MAWTYITPRGPTVPTLPRLALVEGVLSPEALTAWRVVDQRATRRAEVLARVRHLATAELPAAEAEDRAAALVAARKGEDGEGRARQREVAERLEDEQLHLDAAETALAEALRQLERALSHGQRDMVERARVKLHAAVEADAPWRETVAACEVMCWAYQCDANPAPVTLGERAELERAETMLATGPALLAEKYSDRCAWLDPAATSGTTSALMLSPEP
jgi:hypothetical protein